MSFDHAGIVDDAAGQVSRGLGGEVDAAALGLDDTPLFNQRVECACFHFELGRAAQVEQQGLPGAQQDVALRCCDAAQVLYSGGDQRHSAASADFQRTFVAHALHGVAAETVVARQEVIPGDIEGGGDDAAHIDLRRGREQYAIGVDQEDLAIGIECALDHRDIGTHNSVERHGACRGLNEIYRVAHTDVEALPVGGHTVCRLGNRHGLARLGDAASTGNDVGAGRQITCSATPAGKCDRRYANKATNLLAMRQGEIGNSDEGGMHRAPYEAKPTIQAK